MKTFLNVLYRRILYKVPLKWLLLLIAIFCLMFAYSKADNVSDLTTYITTVDTTINSRGVYNVIQLNNSSDYGTYCINVDSISNDMLTFGFNSSLANGDGNLSYNIYQDWGSFYACVYANMKYIYLYNPGNTSVNIKYKLFKLNVLMNTQLPIMTSSQCQTEYSLIPISSVDQNYCTTNNLCPSYNCPSYSGDLMPGVSNVWINDLFHPGAYNIVMNIAEEIDWDYAYTNSGQNLNIDVVGYNVDYEAVQSVIDQQNYKPTQEDFNNLIAILGPYSKIIIFFVFLFIVWAWIKKPFKSKKL